MANAVFPTSGTAAAMAGIALGFLVRQLTGSDLVLALATAALYLLAGLLALLLHRDLSGRMTSTPFHRPGGDPQCRGRPDRGQGHVGACRPAAGVLR